MGTRAKQVPDSMDQSACLSSAGTGIDQQWASVPGCRRFLAVVEDHVVARTRGSAGLSGGNSRRGWSDSSPDSVEVPIRWRSRGADDRDQCTPRKPIGRTQKLSRENVGLDFLTFTWGVAFDFACATVNRVAAQAKRLDRDLVAGIVMKLVVADLMGDDDGFVGGVLMQGNLDQPCCTFQKSEDVLTDDTAWLIVFDLEIVV